MRGKRKNILEIYARGIRRGLIYTCANKKENCAGNFCDATFFSQRQLHPSQLRIHLGEV